MDDAPPVPEKIACDALDPESCDNRKATCYWNTHVGECKTIPSKGFLNRPRLIRRTVKTPCNDIAYKNECDEREDCKYDQGEGMCMKTQTDIEVGGGRTKRRRVKRRHTKRGGSKTKTKRSGSKRSGSKRSGSKRSGLKCRHTKRSGSKRRGRKTKRS